MELSSWKDSSTVAFRACDASRWMRGRSGSSAPAATGYNCQPYSHTCNAPELPSPQPRTSVPRPAIQACQESIEHTSLPRERTSSLGACEHSVVDGAACFSRLIHDGRHPRLARGFKPTQSSNVTTVVCA